MKYDRVELKELCSLSQGLQIPIAERFRDDGPNRYFYITVQFLKDNSDKYFIENPPERVKCNSEDILVVRTGNTGQIITGVDGCFHNNFFKVEPNEKIYPKFLYYTLKSPELYTRMRNVASGTTILDLKHSAFLGLDIYLPDLANQKKIANILDLIDQKIKNCESINNNLFKQLISLYKDWMFNFTPFKDKSFKSSSFGLIPEDWNVGTLGDIIEIFDSKRVPLSGNDRENMEKIYPYYGAASLMDYVDDYIFDGTYLLIGEDGTVTDDKGFPILQYVWGKFWVNNHAHIVKGKKGFNVESLYLLLSQTNIQSIVTGAVQPKVNQNNLKSLEVIIPSKNVMKEFNELIKPFFDAIRSNHDEIEKLQKLRDTLLPKLMSGEIDVSEVNCD